MDFATNFKRLCHERGTSPTAVCLSIGLSSSKVNLWNKGGIPKGDVMVKLAQKLDCRVMDFFADEEDLITNVEFALDEDEKDIIKLYRRLSRKEKHEFMAKIYWYDEKITTTEGVIE